MKLTVTESNIDKFVTRLAQRYGKLKNQTQPNELTQHMLERISGGQKQDIGESYTKWLRA